MRLFFATILATTLSHGAAAQQDDTATPPKPAKLMTLEAGPSALQRTFFGRVRARETVDLAFQVSGQIVRFPVQEGEAVPAGDLIAQLDLQPFERALEQARVNAEKARRDLARFEDLSRSAVSEVQVADAQTNADLAEISEAEAEDALEDATLTVAFDGLTAKRLVANYTTVQAGTPVVRMHDMSELRVDVEVPEILFRRASRGEDVTFTAIFPNSDGAEYPLAQREVEAETADVAQTFTLTLAFTTEVPAWVLPGASVTVNGSAPRNGGAEIIVPETALVFSSAGEPGVFTFEPEAEGAETGIVSRVPVEIEVRDDARIAVTGGAEPGTVIVAAGAAQLTEGQRVRRFTGLGGE